MTLFIDASAAVSMLALEEDADLLLDRVDADENRIWSVLARWETTAAFARIRKTKAAEIAQEVQRLAQRLDFRLVPITDVETALALDAHDRFGRRSKHPANLNMGDCFAYACAKTNGARLLYKGNDFIHTDLR